MPEREASVFDSAAPPYEAEKDVNTELSHEEHLRYASENALIEKYSALAAESQRAEQAEAAPTETAPEEEPQAVGDPITQALSSNPADALARGARDVVRGVVETPRAVVSGALRAVNELPSALSDLAESLPDLGGGIEFGTDEETGEFSIGLASASELDELPSAFRALPDIPEPDRPESTTGQGIESISQFITGFAGAGRIRPLQALSNLGRAGAFTAAAGRGALADFAAFDPHEDRLSNLIQEFPALENPISEFLAADPEDSGSEGRLKAAIEGIGLGVAVDGITAGVKILQRARRGRAVVEDTSDIVAEIERTVEVQRPEVERVAGKPDAPLLSVSRGDPEGPADVFVNWGRIDSPDEVREMVQELADANAGNIDAARRGRHRSFAQTELDAEQIDAWDALTQRREGEPLNAETSLAVRELWATSGARVVELAEEVKANPDDVIRGVAFRKQLAVHNVIQEQVIAARTETARALASWRIPAGETLQFAAEMDEMGAKLLHEAQTTSSLANGISEMARHGGAVEVDSFINGSLAQRTAGGVRQLWYSSLLSGPHTHIRNITSQTAVLGQQMLERRVASAIGRGLRGEADIPAGESMAQMTGLVQGFRDAFRTSTKGRSAFREAWETGQSGVGIGKVETPDVGAFDPERWNVSRETPWGKALSFIDAGSRMPTRALAAEDEVFKSMGFRMELNAQAYRKAFQEVENGTIAADAMQDRMASILLDPDESLELAARMNAEDVTFTANPGRDATIFNAMRALQKIPVLGRMTVPFTRTPYQIANYAFSRTPLALATKQVRADILAGGAKGDLALSRMMTGSAYMLVAADMAMRGQITGEGPSNFAERQTLLRTNEWKPMSIKIGGHWFSYRGMEPVATHLGIAANMVEILSTEDFEDQNEEFEGAAIAAAMSIANQLTSQQYMSGLSSFFEAANDPTRFGESWWQRAVSSVVPTGAAQINRALVDPIAREVVSAVDAIKARTFGLSRNLPAKRDLWGKEISFASQWGPAYDLIVPMYGTNGEDAEPIDEELLRLGAPMGRPPKRITYDGIDLNLELYPKAYSRYVELQGNAMTHSIQGIPIDMAGRGLKDTLNDLVTGKHPLSAAYDLQGDGSEGGKARMIRGYLRNFRDAAKEQLVAEFPELDDRVRQEREERGDPFIR